MTYSFIIHTMIRNGVLGRGVVEINSLRVLMRSLEIRNATQASANLEKSNFVSYHTRRYEKENTAGIQFL